jgi:CSLREA domain-containing protein
MSLQQHRRFHPQVASLEDRLAPAIITVTSLDDNINPDGQVTLREALIAANTNAPYDVAGAGEAGPVVDQIVFAPA